jgi:hypothetical protein
MTPIGQIAQDLGTTTNAADSLRVRYQGNEYVAECVSGGAAYEIFAEDTLPGFLPNRRPGAHQPFRRFVPACDAEVVRGAVPQPGERALSVPVFRDVSWATVHELSQVPRASTSGLLANIRDSIDIHRGTRMVKVLSGRQLAGHLHGWLPQGFCYREFDIAHLRTPAELAILRSDGKGDARDDVIFALRWRAVDPLDYEIPYIEGYNGLVRMPPRDRLGPAVLGTGFAPSGQQLIPEYVTAGLADLPYPAWSELVAFTSDGTEVMLYNYLPEQRTWTRLFGPQWRHLFAGVPGIAPEQEYFAVPPAPTRLVGRYRGEEYETIADPPSEFRVLAKIRSARYAVESLARRTTYGTWRGVLAMITRVEGDWLRLCLPNPSRESVAATGATCIERGIYEVWAAATEVTVQHSTDIRYDLS